VTGEAEEGDGDGGGDVGRVVGQGSRGLLQGQSCGDGVAHEDGPGDAQEDVVKEARVPVRGSADPIPPGRVLRDHVLGPEVVAPLPAAGAGVGAGAGVVGREDGEREGERGGDDQGAEVEDEALEHADRLNSAAGRAEGWDDGPVDGECGPIGLALEDEGGAGAGDA
jgi:hypothetical protein